MSLSTQTQHRLPYIKEGFMKGANYVTIGQACGVTERTIDRDVKAWIESGEFETWLKEEWLRLHHQTIHDNPELAYVQISRLVGHMLTRRIEKKEQIDIREKVAVNITSLLAEYEPALKRAAETDIRSNHSVEQVDSSQANAETS